MEDTVNIRMKDGRELSGTALQIVQQMQSLAIIADGYSVEQYVKFVVENTQRFEDVALTVTGSTPDELAASLIEELRRAGLITAA
jgi:hypothetical protein